MSQMPRLVKSTCPYLGTITEDGLDMWGVLASTGAGWQPPERDVARLEAGGRLVLGLATCHDLNIIGGQMRETSYHCNTIDIVRVTPCRGDPLDERMFASTGWRLEQGGDTQVDTADQFSMPYVR